MIYAGLTQRAFDCARRHSERTLSEVEAAVEEAAALPTCGEFTLSEVERLRVLQTTYGEKIRLRPQERDDLPRTVQLWLSRNCLARSTCRVWHYDWG